MLVQQKNEQSDTINDTTVRQVKHMTEAELIKRLQEGCEEAYKYLIDMYSAMLYGVILRITKNDDDAQNILQDTFIKIWTHIALYDASKGRLATWTLNIARNTAIDFTRSKIYSQRSKNQNIEQTVGFETDKLKTHIEIDNIGLRQLVNTLPLRYREIIEWMYFEGFTQQEIAIKLDVPIGTVKTRTRHAVLQLRKIFAF
jgi:RNA polymerase sigma factor (sigma-70 family)